MRNEASVSRDGALAAAAQRTVETVARLVEAAQRAGEFGDGDPGQIAAPIVGALHGHAEQGGSGVLARRLQRRRLGKKLGKRLRDEPAGTASDAAGANQGLDSPHRISCVGEAIEHEPTAAQLRRNP